MSRKDHGDLVRVGVLDQDVLAQYAFKHLLEESQEIRVVATWKDIFAVSDAQLAEMDILLVAVETVLAAGVDLADYLSVLIEKVAVLAVSARKDPGFVVTCVKVGVAGMVWKGADPASILQAVRDSLAGEQPIVPPVEDNSVSYALKHDIDGYFELTDREHEVLGLIAS
jgi:DNA-binding NarL/FixJ family response regulator